MYRSEHSCSSIVAVFRRKHFLNKFCITKQIILIYVLANFNFHMHGLSYKQRTREEGNIQKFVDAAMESTKQA